jgi:hypothetical protein
MAASKVSDLTLGNFLKIVSQNGVYNQLSESSEMWDYLKKMKAGNPDGRERRFALRQSYGSSAVSFLPVSGGEYPVAHQGTLVEGIMNWKDYALTIEVERTLIAKALSDMGRYGEPLAEEINAKTIAMSRELAKSLPQDGTGIIGEVSSVSDGGSYAIITLRSGNTARGFVGYFEPGDRVVIANPANGAARNYDTDVAPAYWEVKEIDRDNNIVQLQPKNSSHADVAFHSGHTVADGDSIYRLGIHSDGGLIAKDSIVVGTTDLASVSSMWCGLEAYAGVIAAGQKVNGITLNGVIKASAKDAGGSPLDVQHFQQLMSKIRIAVGAGRYKYDSAFMSYENLDKLVESREVDRRFNSIQDNKRGVAELGYVAGKDTLIFKPDEFVSHKRIYVLPKADVVQFFGSDFEFVKPDGGQKFFLANSTSSSGGHTRKIRAYMEGSGAINCIHPAAIGVIHNFT